jgi:hypothetical protein
MIQSFVGNVPPTYLVGESGKALIASSDPQAAALMGATVGVLVLEPELAEHRDGKAAASFGTSVKLVLGR